MTDRHPIDLVIFDCDGVLIDSEVISTRCLVEGLGTIGCAIDPKTAAERFVGRSWASIVNDIEEDWGRSLPSTFAEDLDRHTMSVMASELEPIPGIAGVLETLSLPRCVASSSSVAWIRQGLTSTGLIDYLAPHLFSASMVENGKPAPDIFLHAAKEMTVPSDRAVVIEDSLPGVQAGAAAGMTAIGFAGGSHIIDPDHTEKLRSAGASYVIDDMKALPGILEELS